MERQGDARYGRRQIQAVSIVAAEGKPPIGMALFETIARSKFVEIGKNQDDFVIRGRSFHERVSDDFI